MRSVAIAPERRPTRSPKKQSTRSKDADARAARPPLFARPSGKILAGALMAAVMGGIVGNAMLFQKGRHPAPLFAGQPHPDADVDTGSVPARGMQDAVTPPPPAADPPPTPRVADQPAATEPPTPQASPKPKAKASPSIRKATARSPAPAAKEDGIARLLGKTDKKTDTTSVLTAQKALRKLGYPVETDGHMGRTTKQALDKFVREHALKSDADLSPKLLRELTKTAGAAKG